MIIEQQITQKIRDAFSPEHLEVHNESHMHNVAPGSESHFKVLIVSQAFAGKRLIQCHRMVNEVLAEELSHHIHALAIHTYTNEKWEATQSAPDSPNCMGGSKR
jgi:BolA protein